MHLRDYFAGQRLTLRSALPVETVSERINEEAGFALSPFTTGVVGYVWWGYIRLRYCTWLFEYNAKPVLCGRLSEDGNGSRLDLRYRAPVWIYAFYLFWYLLLASMAVEVLGHVGPANSAGSETIGPIATLAILAIAPLGLHMFGTRRSDDDLAELLNFLAECAEARPMQA